MSNYKNILIDQGSDFIIALTADDQYGSIINITGATGYSQLKKSYYSSTSISMRVGHTGATGGFYLALGATTSAAADPGRYVYDVKFVWSDGTTKRVKQGIATIDPSVTI